MRIAASRWIVCGFLLLRFCDAAAAPPDEAALSRSALEGYLRETDAMVLAAKVSEQRSILRTRATAAPDETVSAEVIFAQGMSIRSLHDLALRNQVDVSYVELKAPVGNRGEVFTIFVGAQEILSKPGTLEQQLLRSVGKLRLQFSKYAQVAPKEEAAKFEELAFSPMLVFRTTMIGRTRNVSALADRGDLVAATFLHDSPAHVDSYRKLRQINENARASASSDLARTPQVTRRIPLDRVTVVPAGKNGPDPETRR